MMPKSGSTVDPADLEKFNRLGDEWWNLSGSMKPLHQLNPLRIAFIRDEIVRHFQTQSSPRDVRKARPLGGLSLLDIGCGGGLLSEPLARLGAQVTGIDPGADNIAIARRHAEEQDLTIDYRQTLAEELAATGERYDVVTAMEVVEHVTDVEAFIGTCCSLVRPGGLLFAATLNRTLKSFALAIVGAEYVLQWVPRGTHHWEQFVTPDELADAIEAQGLRTHRPIGVVYHPLRRQWSTSADCDVNYMMLAKKDGLNA